MEEKYLEVTQTKIKTERNEVCKTLPASSSIAPIYCETTLIIIFYILMVITFPISLFLCIKILKEYERAVIFRLGRLLDGGAKGPGVIIVIPCIDNYRKVDLRTVSYEAPVQQLLSKDIVPVTVNTVVFYRVSNPVAAICNIEDYEHSTKQMAASAIHKEVGTKNLKEVTCDGAAISYKTQSALDSKIDTWGVTVEKT